MQLAICPLTPVSRSSFVGGHRNVSTRVVGVPGGGRGRGAACCSGGHPQCGRLRLRDDGRRQLEGDATIAPPAKYNYSVGYELHYSAGALRTPLAPMDRNNYFVFDLSSLPGPITAATLVLPAGMLESPVDMVEVFDVVIPTAPGIALADAGALLGAFGAGPSAFDSPMDPAVGIAGALYGNIEGGTGSPIGSKTITTADDLTMISIPLSVTGVTYLNGFLGGVVFLGGSVPSIVVGTGTPQQPFGFTSPVIPGSGPTVPMLLVSAVPEASSLLCVAVGAAVVGGRAVRARWARRLPRR
jgi:hypothetical protein